MILASAAHSVRVLIRPAYPSEMLAGFVFREPRRSGNHAGDPLNLPSGSCAGTGKGGQCHFLDICSMASAVHGVAAGDQRSRPRRRDCTATAATAAAYREVARAAHSRAVSPGYRLTPSAMDHGPCHCSVLDRPSTRQIRIWCRPGRMGRSMQQGAGRNGCRATTSPKNPRSGLDHWSAETEARQTEPDDPPGARAGRATLLYPHPLDPSKGARPVR
jgi:hypothetical protein